MSIHFHRPPLMDVAIVVERAGGEPLIGAVLVSIEGWSLSVLADAPAEFPEYFSGAAEVEDAVSVAAVVVPDEPGLPALGWEAPVGAPEERRWFLIDGVRGTRLAEAGRTPPVPERPIALDLARATRREIPEPRSEEDLERLWGRPLAARWRWRELLGAASAAPGRGQLAPVAPGLLGYAVAVDVAEVSAILEQETPDLEALRAQIIGDLPDPATLRLERPRWVRLDLADLRRESALDWAGPYADALADGSLVAAGIIDEARLITDIEPIASRLGFQPVPDPKVPDIAHAAQGTEPEDAQEEVPAAACFVADVHGIPVRIDAQDVAQTALARGCTLAEATALEIDARRAILPAAAVIIERMRERIGADLVHAYCLHAVCIGDPDERQMVFNLESVLPKHGNDPDNPGLAASIEGIARMIAEESPLQMLSEERWFLRHLRSVKSDALGHLEPVAPQVIEDVSQRPFWLVAAVEDPYHLVYLTEDTLADVGLDATALEAACAAGVAQAVFDMRALRVTSERGLTLGVVCTGSNIATMLAHRPLAARLRERLSPVLGRIGEMYPFAVTTDVIVCAVDPGHARDAVHRMQAVENGLPGTPLAFLSAPLPSGDAAGRLDLHWATETIVLPG